MNTQELQKLREILLHWQRSILEEANRTVGGLTKLSDDVLDDMDLGNLEVERRPLLRIREREKNLLSKIEQALARIDAGTYGVCEGCGQPIALERLRARPVTTLCIACKAEQEEEEKRRTAK